METKAKEKMAVRNWEIRHHESQLLENLRTSADHMRRVTALKTAIRLFTVAVNGTMIRFGCRVKQGLIPWSRIRMARIRRA